MVAPVDARTGERRDPIPLRTGDAGVEQVALGEVARLHLARLLEQTQGLVLMALVEQAGGDPRAPWALRLEAVTIVREERPAPPS